MKILCEVRKVGDLYSHKFVCYLVSIDNVLLGENIGSSRLQELKSIRLS